MKKTPLYNHHVALDAKIVDFAGYQMPLSYTNITDEHMAVRKRCGIFDVSHMGEFLVKGIDALDLLQSILSNDISKIGIGAAQYNCMPNDKGGILDDLIVYRLKENEYLLVVNASNIERDFNWIKSKKEQYNCDIINQSDDWALIAFQGPKALQVAQKLTTIDLSKIEFYHFEVGTISNLENVIISATGYTGSGGFEFYIKNKDAVKLWVSLLKSGSEVGIAPCGLGARDTLRLEMGYCLYGNEIDETTSPLEAGLGWITKINSKTFSSSEIFKSQKTNGIQKKLIGLHLDSKRIARKGALIVTASGDSVGHVTSGGLSPVLNKPIAMAYVSTKALSENTDLFVQIGSKNFPFEQVKPPFIEI